MRHNSGECKSKIQNCGAPVSAQHLFSVSQRWKKASCPETFKLAWKNGGLASGSIGPFEKKKKVNLLLASFLVYHMHVVIINKNDEDIVFLILISIF